MLVGLFVALLALIFLGVPVLLSIGSAALIGIVLAELNPAMFPQKMFTILDSFSLLAMPYFILAGELMSRGGLSNRLVTFAEKVVGHMRGGLGHASLLSSMIFANVSGSATAATAAIGSILIPAMKDRGYKAGFTAGLMACAGIIGSIIPPSMVMIVYGSLAGVSIGGLFLAGILPGLLITVGLMFTTYLHSFHPSFPELRQTTGKFNLMQVLKALPRVWVALLAPVIILGGILGGIFTATEAGVVACVYSFLVSFFVYRSVKFKDLPRIVINAAVTTTMVVGIISVAGAFGWLLSYLDFSELVTGMLTSVSSNPTIVLIVLILTMLFLTMFVESLAILIIMVPVIIQLGRTYGLDPYYLGMLVIMATQIGATTPPVAVGLFVATSIAQTTYDQTLRYCWPFVVTLLVVLILVFMFPALSSMIPNYFLGT